MLQINDWEAVFTEARYDQTKSPSADVSRPQPATFVPRVRRLGKGRGGHQTPESAAAAAAPSTAI